AFSASVGAAVALAQLASGSMPLPLNVLADAAAFAAAFLVLSRAVRPLEPWEASILVGALPGPLRPLARAILAPRSQRRLARPATEAT
ncbi:MAG: hypothetical protein RXP91_06535, partial [Nitrososphaeria archaeon]